METMTSASLLWIVTWQMQTKLLRVGHIGQGSRHSTILWRYSSHSFPSLLAEITESLIISLLLLNLLSLSLSLSLSCSIPSLKHLDSPLHASNLADEGSLSHICKSNSRRASQYEVRQCHWEVFSLLLPPPLPHLDLHWDLHECGYVVSLWYVDVCERERDQMVMIFIFYRVHCECVAKRKHDLA